MIVVLDTNVLVAALSSSSPYHKIVEGLQKKHYQIAISNEIYFEYEEQLSKRYNKEILSVFLSFVSYSSNVMVVEPHFKFQLINEDKDDNKFVDCAIAASAHFLVTNDKHFNILKQIDFPKVKVITVERFIEILDETETHN